MGRFPSSLRWLALLAAFFFLLPGLLHCALAQSIPYSHGDPTVFEQFMLESVNSSRADPGGTAARLGIDLNQGLAPGTISAGPKPPLAFHPQLIQVARGHSDWMLNTGIFSHTGVDGTTPTKRAERAGYPFGVAENIGFRSTNRPPDYALMTRVIHESLVKSVSHRVNVMGESFGVVGIGLRPGLFEGFNAFMGTQNFSDGGATEDSGPFIVGVCYDDADGDNAYDPGEGVGSVRVDTSLGQRHAVTSASGGYAIPLLPVATNTATKNLPFPVESTPWSTVEVHEAQYRAEQIAAAPESTVQVVWSGGPLKVSITNEVVVRQPVRLNYNLVGTDGFFYSRTMVTAQNVKKDLRLQNSATPTPTPSPADTKEQRVAFKLPPKMVYGGEYILRAKFSAKGPVNYAVDPASAAEIDGNKLTILKANAPFTVTASHPGDATWKAAQIGVEGSAAKRPQKIAFTTKGVRKVGDDFTLSVTVNSDLDVTVTSSNPQILRINENGTATALAKGKTELIAEQSGDDNHLPAKPVSRKVSVK